MLCPLAPITHNNFIYTIHI